MHRGVMPHKIQNIKVNMKNNRVNLPGVPTQSLILTLDNTGRDVQPAILRILRYKVIKV